MTDQSDRQTSIFLSYKGKNEFSYMFLVKGESVTNTPKIRIELEKFVKCVLEYFDKYNVPKLKCELLGHNFENLYSVLHELCKTPLDGKICSRIIQCSNPGKEQTSDELTSKQEQIRINIDDKIRRELGNFAWEFCETQLFRACV